MADVPHDPIDLAWAAGFFDGEGSSGALIHGYAKGHPTWDLGRAFRVAIKQREGIGESGAPAVLVRFQRAVGVGRIGGPYQQKAGPSEANSRRGPVYMWYADRELARQALVLLWANLSDVKRAQANLALRASGLLEIR